MLVAWLTLRVAIIPTTPVVPFSASVFSTEFAADPMALRLTVAPLVVTVPVPAPGALMTQVLSKPVTDTTSKACEQVAEAIKIKYPITIHNVFFITPPFIVG